MRLPAYRRGDTGKLVDTSRPHGDAKIEEAPAGVVPEERMVVPIPPAPEPLTSAAKPSATAAKLAATAAQASATESSRTAHGESPVAGTAPTARTPPTAAPTAMEAAPLPETPPALAAKPETVMLDEAVFDQIRLEIKNRLPFFQACADASRRRGSSEVRRVQATWTIAADGTIKEMKVDDVPDAQLATCITRMGSHPFAVRPGTELTIPTPIVFVR